VKRDKHDFIVIGCDGIFDKMDSKDSIQIAWQSVLSHNLKLNNWGKDYKTKPTSTNQHQICGLAVDSLLKCCAMRRTCDNITVVVVAFDNFFSAVDSFTQINSVHA